jgi:hypothetical protein
VHVSPEIMKRYALGELFAADHAAVQEHVADCEKCKHLLVGVLDEHAWSGDERRCEIRMLVDKPASIKLLDPVTSTSPPQRGRVMDESPGGMKIRVQRMMFPRTLIQIRVQEKMVLGVVKYCIQDSDEFLIGVRVVPDFPQS